MHIHSLIQGSPEWHAHRAQHRNASDAPAMMGCSPYKKRDELMRELHTGMSREVDAGTQSRFDDGHRFEALARPLAEQIIGQDLYPVVGTEGRYSASFDGLAMDETVAWEHKTLSAGLRDAMHADCKGFELPLHYRVQLEQQCMVSGANRVLFMASKWSGDELVEERHCWYYPDSMLRERIIAAWEQFERDMAAYTLPAATEPVPIGNAPDALPALRIEVTGQVTASNLDEFKATALAAIRGVNRELTTDADFANAKAAVKWFADVESRLAAAKEHALSQTASIDALFKTIDDINSEARRVRLDLDKLVTRREVEVKEAEVAAARKALDAHIAALNTEIAPMRLPQLPANFSGVIKGKRTLASVRDALNTELATAVIAADAAAKAIRANLKVFAETSAGVEFLFADLHLLVHKAADDFAAAVRSRIATHKAAEAEKERQRAEADEAARRVASAFAVTASIAVPPAAPSVVSFQRPAVANEPATLKLGAICDRLGFTVTAAFLASLGISHMATDKAAKLYRESDWPRICAALIAHIECVSEPQAA